MLPIVKPNESLKGERHDYNQKDNIDPEYYKIGGIENWDYVKAKLTPTELAGGLKFAPVTYSCTPDNVHKHS